MGHRPTVETNNTMRKKTHYPSVYRNGCEVRMFRQIDCQRDRALTNKTTNPTIRTKRMCFGFWFESEIPPTRNPYAYDAFTTGRTCQHERDWIRKWACEKKNKLCQHKTGDDDDERLQRNVMRFVCASVMCVVHPPDEDAVKYLFSRTPFLSGLRRNCYHQRLRALIDSGHEKKAMSMCRCLVLVLVLGVCWCVCLAYCILCELSFGTLTIQQAST